MGLANMFWLVAMTGVLAAPTDLQPKFVRDANNNMHLVNSDPFSVVDANLERRFNAEKGVVFKLYTHPSATKPQILKWNNSVAIQQSNFSATNPTRFIIHGYMSSGESKVNTMIRQSYLSIGQFNVITVDWKAGSQSINYAVSRYRVASVAHIVSRMIDKLVEVSSTSRNSINLIGHSLGAHIAGVAGRIQKRQLNTIVGLDPAGPLFLKTDKDLLHASDAQYVEVIFTSAGMLGYEEPLGQSNFYANGGRSQPGCAIDLAGKCSHSRSYQLFAESLSSKVGFRSTKCASFDEVWSGKCTPSGESALMGGEPSNNGRIAAGIYLFNTSKKAPFAQRQDKSGLRYVSLK